MNYGFWADAVAILHISTIVAVIGGLLLSFRYKRFRPWEALALIAIVILWSYYGNCPFTIWEQNLRDLAGQSGVNLTSVGFLPYYANKLLSIELSSRTVQHSTFFTGGILFTASIEWFSPFFHIELFKFRKFVRGLFKKPTRKTHLTKARRM